MRFAPGRKSHGNAPRAAKSRSDKPTAKTAENSWTDITRAHEGGEEKWPPGQIFGSSRITGKDVLDLHEKEFAIPVTV
ncbi:hypothetical protein, partial [Pseudomonas lundensis]|uniref:hypothetical protein n=1 Tax=Pseudomonas lundensis TaxID=86185 RepID=UPI001C531EB2